MVSHGCPDIGNLKYDSLHSVALQTGDHGRTPKASIDAKSDPCLGEFFN